MMTSRRYCSNIALVSMRTKSASAPASIAGQRFPSCANTWLRLISRRCTWDVSVIHAIASKSSMGPRQPQRGPFVSPHDEHKGDKEDHDKGHEHEDQGAPGVVRHVARIARVFSPASHVASSIARSIAFGCKRAPPCFI